MENIIKLTDVSFAYGNNLVLQNINLSINKGDFVGLMGRNGSGKSTLIKLIIGQLKPQLGSVALNKDCSIGYVEQVTLSSDSTFPASVFEVVLLGLYSKIGKFKFAKQLHKKLTLNALKIVGMEGFKDCQLSHLSGGQQQKVIIAKALVSNPDVLILDEPTTGIDAQSEKEFLELVFHLNKNHNKTILMSTHDIAKLKTLEKVIVIDDKQLGEKNVSI